MFCKMRMKAWCNDSNSQMRREWWILFKLAVPLMVSAASDYFGKVLTSIFAGQILSTEEFDAVALGNTMTNISGYSMIIAFASPMDSLCTQANGARNWKLFSVTVHRAIACTTLFLIPIIILWLNMERLLILCGQDEGIAHNVYLWTLVYLAMMPAYTIRTIAVRFLCSQGISKPLLYIGIVIYFVWHPTLLTVMFVVLEKEEFLLFPMCNVVTAYVQIICIMAYIKIRKPHRPETFQRVSLSTVFRWKTDWDSTAEDVQCNGEGNLTDHEKNAFIDGTGQFGDEQTNLNVQIVDKGLSEYIHLLVAGVFAMCGEWWAWEVMTLIVGLLGPTQLAVDVIYSVMIPMYYMIPLGFGLAGASRVGTLIGENRYRMAKRIGDAILWFSLSMAILLALLSYGLREYIPRMFTNDQDVIDIAVKLSPLFCAFVVPHMIQGTFQGILRGIKRQGLAALAVFIGPWLISLPLASLLAFHVDWEIFGMWAGNNVGYYVMDAIFLYLWVSFEWDRGGGNDLERASSSEEEYEKELLKNPQENNDGMTDDDVAVSV